MIRPTIKKLKHIAVQNEQYAQRFFEIGATGEQVTVTGSIKFDGAESNRHNEKTRQLQELASIQQQDVVLLAGSTQVEEEKLCLQTFAKYYETYPQLKLILVPRHPERFDEVRSSVTSQKYHITAVLISRQFNFRFTATSSRCHR